MKVTFIFLIVLILTGCNFSVPSVDEKFGKQNFVSAISIIELHKTRNGTYPENLEKLQFLGDWDAIWLSSVSYEKNGSGYNLFITRGWVGKPNLKLPQRFKRGLGIKNTNVTWVKENKT